MSEDRLAEISAAAGARVSRETLERLDRFVELLERWNRKINLVAPATLGQVWQRHVLDSAQLLPLAPENATHWLDLGSGGGFPGIIIAILAVELQPDLSVTLVESDQRKCAFLRNAAVGLKVRVLSKRVEQLPPQQADVISARALAALPDLLDLAAPHLAEGGVLLFPKGESYRAEVAAALATRRFACEDIPSATNPSGAILKIGDLRLG